MRNLWRRVLALFVRPVPVALSVGTGPLLMGGSVRSGLQRPSAIVAEAYSVTEGQWLHAYEGPVRYMTVDQLCGKATWGER